MEMLSVQRKWYSTDSFLIVAQKLPLQQLRSHEKATHHRALLLQQNKIPHSFATYN